MPVHHVRTTAYTPTEAGGGGRRNAHGAKLHVGSAAADWSRFPYGTRFRVRGQDQVFVIDDYGSALVGTNTIDLYMPTRRSMRQWGVRHVDIELIEMGSYQKSREILKPRSRSRYVRKMLRALNQRQAKSGRASMAALRGSYLLLVREFPGLPRDPS